jgi:CheY-like chemotaxis protein
MSDLLNGQLKGWCILLVDDEPDSLEVAMRWLKLAGASVLIAYDGRSGLELAMTRKPDVILADLSMPAMDGWEMQYELKHSPVTACIPVIALTAHALQNVTERVVAAGFATHIAKPFKPDELVSTVLRIVHDEDKLRSGAAEDDQE